MTDSVSKTYSAKQKCFTFDNASQSCVEDIIDQSFSKMNKTNDEAPLSQNNRQSYEFAADIRKIYDQEFTHYMKLLILKTSCIGLLIGFLIITVFYDKLFFENHYYQRTRQYQGGMFGFELNTMENLPNYDPGDKPFFQISSYQSMPNVWYPSQPQNPTAYHQINEDNKKDKYNLEGYIMKEVILTPVKDSQKISQYEISSHLLEVVHNVNFKGEIVVETTQFQKTEEDVKAKKQRIEKILQIQKQRYQKKYEISKYFDHQLPFCVIVPSYNNYESKLYLRNLDSIFMQDYNNYHVVYIDDASPDKTGQYVKKYIQQKGIPKQKIQLIINEKNNLAMANIYDAVHNKCKSGEIVMLLDGDDSFLGRQVMSLFNAAYQKDKSGLVYSRYLVITSNNRAGTGGSSRSIPQEFLQGNKFRETKGFFTSHLLTFYADLFWKVSKEDLTYSNGTFFKFGYDVALITPIIQMVNPRLKFIQQTTYEYRYDTGINDPGWGQMQVDNLVFSKKPYKKLDQYPFIDNFYQKIDNENNSQK